MSLEHWMMFGSFAQQNYFAYPRPDTYDGIIFNANMVAHAPMGLAGFLHKRAGSQKYIIDPQTHAFQHDPRSVTNKDGKTKSSVQGVAEEYGGVVAAQVGRRPVLPKHLTQDKRSELVKSCIEFQLEYLKSYMQRTDAAKYLDDDEREIPPHAVVAPYFYMSETTVDDWLPINLSCIKLGLESKRAGRPLFASIVIDQGTLADEGLRVQVADAMVGSGAEGYLLWIDDFDEQAASRIELQALQDLAQRLRGSGAAAKPVVNLHGGFYSIVLGSALGGHVMSGVAHGPEFGEYRGVVPVGGGIPISRYYVPQLHARIRFNEAAEMLGSLGWLDSAEAFHGKVCDCDVCVSTLDGNADNFNKFGDGRVREVNRRHGAVRIRYPTSEAREACLKHYLQRKEREFASARSFDADVLVRSISRGYHQFKDVTGLDGVEHLRLWLRALGRDVVDEELLED